MICMHAQCTYVNRSFVIRRINITHSLCIALDSAVYSCLRGGNGKLFKGWSCHQDLLNYRKRDTQDAQLGSNTHV